MRSLVLLFLFTCSIAFGDERQNIPMIQLHPYDPRTEIGRDFSKFTSGLGIFFFGGIFKPSTDDIKEDLLKELSRKELNDYLSAEQREALSTRVANTVHNQILSKGLDNAVTVEAIKYSVNELVGEIIQRIMAKEGVKSQENILYWKEKILTNFNSCINKAKTQSEAEKCQESFQIDLVKNIGLAISYEMASQELGEKYSKNSSKKYTECITTGKNTDNSMVKQCVMKAMQDQIYQSGKNQVFEIAKSQTPNQAQAIADSIGYDFKECLNKTKIKSDIIQCADQLTIDAGSKIVSSIVTENPDIISNIPSKNERALLANTASNDFGRCVKLNLQKNIRSQNGIVSTQKCEKSVRNSITNYTIKRLFKNNIQQLISDKESQKTIYNDANRFINKCWKNDVDVLENNQCLRSSILQIINSIADYRLTNDMPAPVQQKNGLKNNLLSQLNDCLNKNLSIDIVNQAKNINNEIDQCTQKITKTATISVAEYEINSALSERIKSPIKVKTLTNKTMKDFTNCLGNAPDTLTIDMCSIKLRKTVGKILASELFPEELDSFVNTKGGLKAFGMNEKDRETFLSSLYEKHGQCLNENLTIEKLSKSDENLQNCFKKTIETFTLFLAEKEFIRSVKDKSGLPAKAVNELTKDFVGEFDSCLTAVNDVKSKISELLQQIDTCTNDLTDKYTKKIAKLSLSESLDQYIDSKGDPEIEKEKTKILTSATTRLEDCEKNGQQPNHRRDCIKEFKNYSTASITLIQGQLEAKRILNAKDLPAPFKEIENELKNCMKNLNNSTCSKKYIVKLSKTIASLKLRDSLGGAIGGIKYKESEVAIANFEKTYFDCVDAINAVDVDKELLHSIAACGDQLENQTLGFLQDKTRQWMAERQSNPQISRELTDFTANAIPCLDKLAHESPFDEEAIKNLDPEGSLQLISHMLGDYINYDPRLAKNNVAPVLNQLFTDLEKAGPVEARKKLLNSLIDRGMLDQFLKSVIKNEVKTTFQGLSPEDKLSDELMEKLLTNENFDQILEKKFMDKFRGLLAEKILGPLIIEGKSMDSPESKAALNIIRTDVSKILLNSEKFGGEIINYSVQKQLDELGFIDRTYISSIYGSDSLNWAFLRRRAAGREAEDYIRENIVTPKFTGQVVNKDEADRRSERAKELIQQAIEQAPVVNQPTDEYPFFP